jgi:hypothetical protein
MNNRYLSSHLFLSLLVAIGIISATSVLLAQDTDRSWMNSKLSPEECAELALKQMTLEKKLALLHGNGMANNPIWTMPLTHLTNGGAGYVEGVKRLGIPPLTGTETAEVYARLPKSADESFKRLVGWKRVRLGPDESQTVTVAIDPQVLQTFDDTTARWNFAPGDYEIVVGASSDNTPLTGSLSVH